MSQTGFEHLPQEIKMYIASMLDYKDLSRCCQVSQDMREICSCDELWEVLCVNIWDYDGKSKTEIGMQEYFREMHSNNGRYISIYKQVSDTWTRIKKHLYDINPAIPPTLKPGLDDAEMDRCESELGIGIPCALRCLLTFHNGQQPSYHDANGKKHDSWFFGKLKSYDYENNFAFAGLKLLQNHSKWFALLSGKVGGHSILCYLGEAHSIPSPLPTDQPINHPTDHFKLKPGNVIAVDSKRDLFYFLQAASPLDFFNEFLLQLDQRRMPMHDGILYRFWGDPKSQCTTRGVHIRVYTSYLLEVSSRQCHVFAYLVEFKMDKGVGDDEACKLETRMWEVESEKGGRNRFEGDGVIGEYPIFRAGTHYTYISCTNIFDSSACMRGHYTVRNLSTNSRYRLQIPEFHMEIPDLKDDL